MLNNQKLLGNETEEGISEKEVSSHTKLREMEQTKLVSSEMSSYDAQQILYFEENSSSFSFIYLQK